MSEPIDSLELEISASSGQAEQGLDKLINALGRLKSGSKEAKDEVAAFSSGLSSFVEQTAKLKSIGENFKVLSEGGKALSALKNVKLPTKFAEQLEQIKKSMQGYQAVNKGLESISTSLERIGKLGDVKIPGTIAKRITEISNAVKDVDDDAIRKLDSITASLQRLSGVDLKGFPAAMRALSSSKKTAQITSSGLLAEDFDANKIKAASGEIVSSGEVAESASEKINEYEVALENVKNAASEKNATSGIADTVQKKIDDARLQAIKTEREIYSLDKSLTAISRSGKSNLPEFKEAVEQLNAFRAAAKRANDQAAQLPELLNQIRAGKIDESSSEFNELIRSLKNTQTEAKIAGEEAKAALLKAKDAAKDTGGEIESSLRKLGSAAINAASKGIGNLNAQIKKFAKSAVQDFVSPVTRSIAAFNKWKSAIGRVAFYRAVRTAIKMVTDGLKEGVNNLYYYSQLAGTAFAPAMDSLASSAQYLKNSFGAMVSPLIEAVAPAVEYLIDKFVELLNTINMAFAALTGKSTYTRALRQSVQYGDDLENSMGGAADAAKEFKKYLIGIDELTIIPDQNDSGRGGGSGGGIDKDYGTMFEEVELPDKLQDFAKKIKDAISKGDWYGAGADLADKLNSLITGIDAEQWGEDLGAKIQNGISFALGFIQNLNFEGMGGSLANFANGLIGSINPENVGSLLSSKIKAAVDFAYGFVQNFQWSNFGTWLGGVVNGWFANIDFAKLGQTVGDGIIGILEGIASFLNGTDFEKIGEDIAEFLKNINWEGIAEAAGKAFESLKKALSDLVQGLLVGFDVPIDLAIKISKLVPSLAEGLGFAYLASKVMGLFGISKGKTGLYALSIGAGLLLLIDSLNTDRDQSLTKDSVTEALLSGALVGLPFAAATGGISLIVAPLLTLAIHDVTVNWDNINKIKDDIVKAAKAAFNGDKGGFWNSVSDAVYNFLDMDSFNSNLVKWIGGKITGLGDNFWDEVKNNLIETDEHGGVGRKKNYTNWIYDSFVKPVEDAIKSYLDTLKKTWYTAIETFLKTIDPTGTLAKLFEDTFGYLFQDKTTKFDVDLVVNEATGSVDSAAKQAIDAASKGTMDTTVNASLTKSWGDQKTADLLGLTNLEATTSTVKKTWQTNKTNELLGLKGLDATVSSINPSSSTWSKEKSAKALSLTGMPSTVSSISPSSTSWNKKKSANALSLLGLESTVSTVNKPDGYSNKTKSAKSLHLTGLSASITKVENSVKEMPEINVKARIKSIVDRDKTYTMATGGLLSGGKWHPIQNYASGGLMRSAQLFFARENGLPELVGRIGSNTAVMNNGQIVSSVASGVYQAVSAAFGQLGNYFGTIASGMSRIPEAISSISLEDDRKYLYFPSHNDVNVSAARTSQTRDTGNDGAFSDGMRSANEDVISVIFAAATRIVTAIQENGGDVYMDSEKVGQKTTQVQNRNSRIYGHAVQNG